MRRLKSSKHILEENRLLNIRQIKNEGISFIIPYQRENTTCVLFGVGVGKC